MEVGEDGFVRTTNGVVDLKWAHESEEGAVEFELQQSATRNFSLAAIRYRGPQRSSYLTGLPEGTHYFRIRIQGEDQWSDILEVKVEFISRGTLLGYFSVGLIVSALTIGSIIAGYLKEVKGAQA